MKQLPSVFCFSLSICLFCALDRSVGSSAEAVTGAIVYPAPGQKRVPLWFPGNETPDPLPEAKDKLAGYPITVMFPRRASIASVTAHLMDKKEREVAIWLSTPQKPANPKHADSQQNTVCLIAKRPLRADTTYTVRVEASVDDRAWSATWSFTTLSDKDIHEQEAGTLLRTLNELRRRAGLPPVAIDAEASKACAAHAHYLELNFPGNPMLGWNEEKPNLPGYTKAGAAIAPTASIQGGGGPREAVTGLVDSLISRPQVLDANLAALGLGYVPFRRGGWIWVMDLRRRRDNSNDIKELLYPAPDQKEIPLAYPADEVPSPIPAENKSKKAGYAVTATFPRGTNVTNATGKLADEKGQTVPVWFSTPAKPAIPDYPQRSLCLLPHKPLKSNVRYTATFAAEVDGRMWKRTWSFTTLQHPDRFADDIEEKILARVNAVRKTAGLSQVRLDAALSRGCRAHARYLALNAINPRTHGMAVHKEDAALLGATPQGARAADKSVIAVLLDPRTCVDDWMATLYHRIPILAPDLERIGFGHADMGGRKWACVLDTGNGRSKSAP